VDPDLPCYLLGHSMGGLTVNTFLANNPAIASKLSGVIFSAPLFGIVKKQPWLLQKIIEHLSETMNELVFVPDL
jgi:alpha-beta hydrolase superfamily lysophospholipase